jgi:hypothetical protein
MTDNEIIKALEICGNSFGCNECPYYDKGNFQGSKCSYNNAKDAVDLINRQKAEIERLSEELRKVRFDYVPIDALMDEFCSAANYNDYGKITLLHISNIIDRVKEMVGD